MRIKGFAVEEINNESMTRYIVMLGSLFVVLLIAAYAVTSLRRKINDKNSSTNEIFTNFRDMHERGMLSDNEFRNIKTRMASRLQAELSDSKESA